jgi:hypothetical protein
MLAPTIIEHIPLGSADSAMVARNVNRYLKWSGTFASRTKAARAITLRDRIRMRLVRLRGSGFESKSLHYAS